MGSINDWADKEARLTANASPQSQSSSTRTVVQEPDGRPPVLPNQQPVFPHKHASLPTPSPDGASPYTRQLTDPIPQDRASFFPQAVLAEQARLHGSSPNSTTLPTSRLSAHIPARLTLEEPLSRSPATESSTSPDHSWWDINQVEPGTVLFSTGPVMSKPPPPNPDLVRRASTDQSHWVTPSGIPSTKVPPDTVSSQDRDVPQPGYAPESPSLVYTTGHPANTGSHTGYQMNYPPYSPNNPAFGPSSPRHPSFGASGAHAQGNTYLNPGSGHAYPAYRPGMPYGAYPAYQGGYPSSPPMGASFGPMAGGFPGAYSGASAPNGYNNTPPSNSYQGSPVAGGYSSPTGAYGMHFAPYGMVSAPPMYAPATYAHAPYGHPYLSPQGHTEEGSAGMWWFMPAASGAGTSNMQSGQVYGAQPQAQAYVQRFGSSQQPPSSQPIPGMLNTSSSNTQQPGPGGFSPTAHSPTIALSSVATGSVASPTSPHQMYASFASMGLQSPQPPAIRHPPSLVMPAGAQAPPQPSATPLSPVVHSPTRPTSTPKGRASAASKSGPGGSRVTSPATTRRPWHPNPPVARSDWVMWVGNVPSDATHDELWAFFNQDTTAREPIVTSGPGRTLLPPPTPVAVDGDGEHSHGVSSVFLISRSNCAFVNYEEEVSLTRAVSFFNGRSLRPHASRCPRLVCRVRRKDDDLRAGVGGQRGLNMHARWIQEQERRAGVTDKDTGTETEDPATSPSTYLGPASSSEPSPPILAAVDEANNLLGNTADHLQAGRDGHLVHHSGSGSTNSSFLARNFPKRYFILKSLTQFDLNISVERGLWATQAHNESTLDRAYRTSKDVFLIFSANKSGEWFGYARMDGPIIGSQQSVSWESRGQPKSPTSPMVQRKPEAAEPIEPGQPGNNLLFSPSEHKFATSPAPITPGTSFPSVRTAGQASAPPELGEAHKQLTVPEHSDYPDHIRSTTGAAAAAVHANDFQLDHNAPHRAVRDAFEPSKEQDSHVDADGVVHRDTALTTDELERARGLSGSMDDSIGPIRETLAPSATPGEERAEGWGKPFKIRWIKTERLPFHRTRHLRNPWNSDREVKVSRDGTEVEPGVGQRLLDEWENVAESESPPAVTPSTAKQTNLPSRPGMQPSYGSAPQPSRGRPRQ